MKKLNVYLTLGFIALVQFVAGLATMYAARHVFCRDDSFLGIASLLKGVVERLPGNPVSGEQIWGSFPKTGMWYGEVADVDGFGDGSVRIGIVMSGSASETESVRG